MLARGVVLLIMVAVGCGDGATPAPILTVVSPAEGSALGGTQLTLGGTNFESGVTVSVGGTPATQVIVLSPTAIQCLSPPGTPGVVDVAVTTSGGTATLEDAFTYYPTPSLTNVEPARGPPFGGTLLTLTGTGFTANEAGTNTVTVGGAACTGVDVVSDTEVTCTSPAGTAGAVDVVLENANGITTLEDGYEYFSTILVADGGGFVGDKGNLYAFDADTGEAFPIGPIGFPVTAMDFHPETGVLYGVTGSATAQLITIDPTTGEGTVVGNLVDAFGNYQVIPGISFVGSVLYGTNAWNEGLVTIDVTSGRVDVRFGGVPFAPGGGFAADAESANVYYMTSNTAPIYSVNVTTGVFTPGPTLQGSGGNFDRIPGATFHNGSLYAIESSPRLGDRQLVVIDVSTGAITPIGGVYPNSAFNAIASNTREAPLCEGVVCEDDGNECTSDVCNPDTGTCDYPKVQDGTPCTDGFCLNGVCEVLCDVANVCQCSEFGIRAAIQAGGNDPYTFDCVGPTTVVTKATIDIDNNVILDGEGNLRVDGNDTHRVFSAATGTTAELRGMAITGGQGDDGGGIENYGVLTLTDCMVSDNFAWWYGGGIANGGVLTLTNSTVSGNYADEGGGGIASDFSGGELTLTNSTVSGNSAWSEGGGILNGGLLTVTNSTVSGNSAEEGGGIANYFEGMLTLTNSTVSGNSAYGGGGITNREGVLTLTNSTVSNNAASSYGGGILNLGELTLTNSTVSGNSSDYDGGGIENGYALLTATNSTVSNNEAFNVGGGINNDQGLMALTNCTLSGNSASVGRAIYDYYATSTVTNTLVDGDCAAFGAGGTGGSGGTGGTGGLAALTTSGGYNIESPGNTCGFGQATDQPAKTPVELNLGPLANNGGPTMTHKPGDGGFGSGSVAIDWIPEADCVVSTDQRGQPRPETGGSRCDVGSVEVQDGTGGTGGNGGMPGPGGAGGGV